MISADETIRRADECLDQWRGLSKEARDYTRSDYARRLRDLGYPPDVITRWLDAKRPTGVRPVRNYAPRPIWPLRI